MVLDYVSGTSLMMLGFCLLWSLADCAARTELDGAGCEHPGVLVHCRRRVVGGGQGHQPRYVLAALLLTGAVRC